MLHPPYRHARFPRLLAAAFMSVGLAAGAQAQSTDGSTTPAANSKSAMPAKSSSALDRADRKFIEKAANGGLMEVQLGEMAQQKASSDQVKEFGKKMAEDHGKANDELKQVAEAKGVALPAAVDRSGQKDLEKFGKLQGADFDREYMKHMVSDHKKDVSDFQKEAKSGKDAEVKAFAAKTLPTLQQHMTLAQSTYDAVKSSGKSGMRSGTSSSGRSSSGAASGTGNSPMPGTAPTTSAPTK